MLFYYIILYYIILYYSILYYIIVYCIILYCRFKQYKQWSSGFHMLQRANLLYAKELRRVALEIGGTLKEGSI